MLHKDAILGDAHFPHTWQYANASARTGATGFVSADVFKLALQLDTNALYILTAITPTWTAVGVTGGAVAESNTVAGWASANPVLALGAFGYESDTTKFKIGDGATAWTALPHWRYVPEHQTINTTGGTTVLTAEQNKATSIQTTGILVSNAIIVVDDVMAPFVAENSNTGAYTTTFKTAAGSGVAVSQATHQLLYADGTNVEEASSAGAGSGDVVGPASAVNLRLAVFSGTTGKLIADGGVAVSALEVVANKATTFGTVNDTLYPSVQAVKTYADGLVVGLLDDRGSYDASVNTFPAGGGSGTAGAILKGDLWYISVAGTLGGSAVNIGDSVRALTDTPGQTASNWSVLESNIGFVPENSASKDVSGGYVGKTLEKINAWNAARTFISFIVNAATAARTWTFPDKDGTVAMTSDITGTNSGTNTGDQTSIVGISGTIAQFNTACSDDNFAALGTAQTFTKTQSAAITALTSAAASIAVDLSLSNNFSHTLTENTTLAAPTNPVAGTSGQIVFTQHAASAKTLAFNAAWISVSGSAGVISTTLNAVNILSYYVVDSTHIWYSWNTAAATAASSISNAPAGSIAATDVQAAINELDTEKAALAGSASQAFSTAALTAAGLVDISGASAGQIKFPATQNPSADANTLDDYDEYTAASAACTGAVTATVVWEAVKAGKKITLTLPPTQSAGVATTNFAYGTLLPAKYRPASNQYFPIFIVDNGVTLLQTGAVIVSTVGAITVFKDSQGAGNFTVTATAGLPGSTSFSWRIA